jgi:GT2 family glycosyltransferase
MSEGHSVVAAVIPHFNRVDLLRVLLANLARQTRRFDRVIVVDNGSTDGSVQEARRAGAEVIELPRNLGFAAAVNRGIEAAAEVDWVAVLNNDVTLAPEWLERLLAAAEDIASEAGQGTGRGPGGPPHTDPVSVWFAAGKIRSASDPSRIDGCFDEISRGACAWRCGSGREDGPAWDAPRAIRIAPMTAALFRRELFTEIGLLDERFVSYLEDVDFGLRCAAAGRTGAYVPAAVAYHQGSATLGKWNKDTVRYLARNQVLLAAKHFRGMPRWPLVVGQLLWGLVAIRHGRALSYLRGKAEGLRLARVVGHEARNKFVPESIASITEESERTILELQQQAGFDSYWRAYFWLLRR